MPCKKGSPAGEISPGFLAVDPGTGTMLEVGRGEASKSLVLGSKCSDLHFSF